MGKDKTGEKKRGGPRPGSGRKPGFKMTEPHKRKLSHAQQRHGVFCAVSAYKEGRNFLDLRTKAGKDIQRTYEALLEEQGVSPSVSEQLLANFVRSDLAVLYLINKAILADNKKLEESQALLNFFLKFQKDARENISKLQDLRGDKGSGSMTYDEYVAQLKSGNQGDAEDA